MKREIKSAALLIIALFSILLGIALCSKVEALANYVIYICIALFAVTVSIYAFILKFLDSKKPLEENTKDNNIKKPKKVSSYSLFPSPDEIEAASKIEIATEEDDENE